jgi:23S rRNA (cytosine1962-C5)-methyltransferase
MAGSALVLKPGREKSLRARHPWVFSGAVAGVDGSPDSGTTVDILGADGAYLARGAYSPQSQIRARVWTFADETIDEAFFARKVAQAVAARGPLIDARHTGVRLVHGEADGLPGVVADRYGDVVVLQLSSAGADAWRGTLVSALRDFAGAVCVVERSDAEVRALEGLAPVVGVVAGTLPPTVTMLEDGLDYAVDVLGGQKTGFYLDQRDNRLAVRRHAAGRRVLNAFCYTGGFTLAALAGGARTVLSLDTSGPALAQAAANLARNPTLPAAAAQWREADVFTELRNLRNTAAQFDLIVLDPPKFAPTAAHAERASRAYKDINLLALKLLAPDGLLATFSCSGGISADLFQKIVAGAAQDAQAQATIVARLAASADHPVALAFPEGDYLKGLLLRRMP